MDLSAYKAKKQKLQSETAIFKRERTCYNCFWLMEHCRCHLIKPFDTSIRFVILMHPMEAKREKLGTGRICRAAIKNSEILVGLDFTDNPAVNALIRDPSNHC